MSDGRRRRWIPLSVEFPFDKTGTRLQEEFGAAGLAVWVALLTAAKRAPVQGTFSYTTEAEAWSKLGILEAPFPFDEFVRFTGRIKKTRKRRRGRITDVQITAWEQWNNTVRERADTAQTPKRREKTSTGREENPRSTAVIANPLHPSDSDSDSDSDSEKERENEIDESNPFFEFLKRRTRPA